MTPLSNKIRICRDRMECLRDELTMYTLINQEKSDGVDCGEEILATVKTDLVRTVFFIKFYEKLLAEAIKMQEKEQ